ncbi:MAG TPA: hypothetical protein VKU60_01135, partial [Chloroflexota bacterium]|nr:hypothetical protein [Chloroflexota bacterium]
ILWFDPLNYMGILLGQVGAPGGDFGRNWPGLLRPAAGRDMSPEQIEAAVALRPPQVAQWAAMGVPITDDNQLLAYGLHRHRGQRQSIEQLQSNTALVQRLADEARSGG